MAAQELKNIDEKLSIATIINANIKNAELLKQFIRPDHLHLYEQACIKIMTENDNEYYTKLLKEYTTDDNFRKIYIKNKADGLYDLACKYSEGLNEDESKRTYWCIKSAELGNSKGQYHTSDIYFEGRGGIEKDNKIGLYWLEKSISNHNSDAMYKASNMYINGNYVEKDEKRGITYLLEAVKHKHSEACYEMGLRYREGKGVNKDEAFALTLFIDASNNNHMLSIFNAGEMYYYGIGTISDKKIAYDFLKRIEKCNHSESLLLLSTLYNDGITISEVIDGRVYGYEPPSFREVKRVYLHKDQEKAKDLLMSSKKRKFE